jgi:hypothetical protein
MVLAEVITLEPKNVVDRVIGFTNRKVGEMMAFKRDSQAAELDAYNAMAGTVHGKPVVGMLDTYHSELGNLNVDAYHVMVTEVNGKKRYGMVIEFGRDPVATA